MNNGDQHESILKALRNEGLKPEQTAYLAQNINEVLSHAKASDQVDRNPWRKSLIDQWLQSPKRAKILRMLRKANYELFEIAKSNSQEVLQVTRVIAHPEGVNGINNFDEVIILWPHGYNTMIVDRTFESELLDHKDVALIRIAEGALERSEFDPVKGKAVFLHDGTIKFDRQIAGKGHYHASGVAQKMTAIDRGTELRFKIVKKDLGYEVVSSRATLFDTVKPIVLTAAVAATMVVAAKQAPEAISSFNTALAVGQLETEISSQDQIKVTAEDRTSIVASIRDFSFTLDLIGGEPGKEVTLNPLDIELRSDLYEAIGDAILANFDADGEIHGGLKKNSAVVGRLLELTPKIEQSIKDSTMSETEKAESLKMLKSAEKRAKYAQDSIQAKMATFAKASY